MPNTKNDNLKLLLFKIKEKYPEFEKCLVAKAREIETNSNGLKVSADYLLQVLYLYVKKDVRIKADEVTQGQIDNMYRILMFPCEKAVTRFANFLVRFNVNNPEIVPSLQALMPILIYYIRLENYMIHSDGNCEKLERYFVKSQTNNWGGLQSHINNFTKIIIENVNSKNLDFPIEAMEDYVREKHNKSL